MQGEKQKGYVACGTTRERLLLQMNVYVRMNCFGVDRREQGMRHTKECYDRCEPVRHSCGRRGMNLMEQGWRRNAEIECIGLIMKIVDCLGPSAEKKKEKAACIESYERLRFHHLVTTRF